MSVSSRYNIFSNLVQSFLDAESVSIHKPFYTTQDILQKQDPFVYRALYGRKTLDKPVFGLKYDWVQWLIGRNGVSYEMYKHVIIKFH